MVMYGKLLKKLHGQMKQLRNRTSSFMLSFCSLCTLKLIVV